MREVDPDVQALLDDLPATKLPQALVEQGWGKRTMATSVDGRTRKQSTEFQPVYDETCVRCGRPITESRYGVLVDHGMNQVCDGALLDGQPWGYHLRKGGVAKPRPAEKKKEPVDPICNAKRERSKGCDHICTHPTKHFGFHECVYCHHLWR